MGKASNFNSVRETNLYFFGEGGHKKLQKNDFFCKTVAPEKFIIGNFFQHKTMWKLTSRRFPKLYKLWGIWWFLHQLSPLNHSSGDYRSRRTEQGGSAEWCAFKLWLLTMASDNKDGMSKLQTACPIQTGGKGGKRFHSANQSWRPVFLWRWIWDEDSCPEIDQ